MKLCRYPCRSCSKQLQISLWMNSQKRVPYLTKEVGTKVIANPNRFAHVELSCGCIFENPPGPTSETKQRCQQS